MTRPIVHLATAVVKTLKKLIYNDLQYCDNIVSTDSIMASYKM